MKVLFTADLHIKLGQKNVPIEWAKARYRILFKQFADLQPKADLFVIGGDIFDKTPSMEELEFYFELIDSITIPCIIYSGNHEAIKKNTTFFSYLKNVTSKLNKLVTIIDDYHTIENIDFIPYNKLKEAWPRFNGNILCTHVRGEIPPHVKPEVDLSLFEPWELVLAGDLHSYENSQGNILYPGSPLTTSFHRSTVYTGILLVDTVTLKHEFLELVVPQLLKMSIKAGDPMPASDYHHTIYEVEGSMAELGVMEDNELVSKRVIKREMDTSLILDNEMTLAQEVEEYLRYILNLSEQEVQAALLELHNYAK